MNFDSAVFYSDDIKQAILFYKNTFGLPIEYQDDTYVSFVFPNGVRLGIKSKEEDRELPGAQTIILSVENIEEMYEDIKKKNVPMYTNLRTYDWGKHFSILDPDKNKIEFIEK